MDFLEAEGYDVYHALSGEEALSVYEDEGAKLIILDVMLPGVDGLEICRRIREKNNDPILIVSALGSKDDKLNGIIAGADDYIEKPYDIDIMLAKIQGIFKRRYGSDVIRMDNLCLDKEKRLVTKDNEPVPMTAKEFELLLYMMEHRDKVLKKDELFANIWGHNSESESQTLTVHIKWLREKLEEDPKNPKKILTVWGVGYRFQG